MKFITNELEKNINPSYEDDFNNDSAWYYNHELYFLGISTHGMWLSEYGADFGLDIPELDLDSEWNSDWEKSIRLALSKGFVRIQKFNDIATITVLDFSEKEKNRVFNLFLDYPDYLDDCNWIELVTLEWEMKYSDYDESQNYESQNYENDNYICGESIKEIMEKLG